MKSKKTDQTLSAIAALMGSRGGKVKSAAKKEASRKNIRKAIARRWKLQPT